MLIKCFFFYLNNRYDVRKNKDSFLTTRLNLLDFAKFRFYIIKVLYD
jgi:hypothetical protein